MTPQRPLFYALSSSKYPLINLAPPPRPGSFANGTFALSEDLPERDQLLPYLLDPAVERENAVATTEVMDVSTNVPENRRLGGGHSQGWLWKVNVLGAIMLLVGSLLALLLRWKRRSKTQSKDTKGEKLMRAKKAGEKTPLLEQGKTLEKDTLKEKDAKRTVSFAIPATDQGDADAVSIPEGTEAGTPKKKSTRRRVRGKKKPKNPALVGGEDDIEDDGEEGSPGEASDVASAKSGKLNGEKPLPDLPREMSAVDLTHLAPQQGEGDDKERLSISDTVIGTYHSALWSNQTDM